jgi:hypothetical protein
VRTLWIRVDLPTDDDNLAMGVDDITDGLNRILHFFDHRASAEVLDTLPDADNGRGSDDA